MSFKNTTSYGKVVNPPDRTFGAGIIESTREGAFKIHLDCHDARQWNELLLGFDDVSYDQTTLPFPSNWPLKDISHLAVTKNDKIIGGAQVYIRKVPGIGGSVGIAYIKKAPFWQRKGEAGNIEHLKATLAALVEVYAHKQGLCLTILPAMLDCEYQQHMEQALQEYGFRKSGKIISKRAYLVDCYLSEEEQKKSLHQKWRYNLKQGLKNDILVKCVDFQTGLKDYLNLHSKMKSQKGFQDRLWIKDFPDVESLVPKGMLPKLFFAYQNDVPVAGAVICQLSRTASYLFGASDQSMMNLRAGYVLHWHIVNQLRQDGARWYDLEDDGGVPGLRQFKAGLVGKAGHVIETPCEYSYCERLPSRALGRTVQALRAFRNKINGFN